LVPQPRILPTADTDVAAVLHRSFTDQGVHIITDIGGVYAVEPLPDGRRRLRYDRGGTDHALDVDQVVMSVGWPPALDGLGLETAGLTVERGRISADRIERVLTDNAKASTESVLFTQTAAGLGIRGKRTRPYRPQTNGKVERFNKTMLDEWAYGRLYRSNTERCRAFTRWLRSYNHRRSHTALAGLTRWRPSSTMSTGTTPSAGRGGRRGRRGHDRRPVSTSSPLTSKALTPRSPHGSGPVRCPAAPGRGALWTVRRWLAERWPLDRVAWPGRELLWEEYDALPDR
jgi:Integrase core domain/Pyridine nucleotide-disulphide oxidoreductase